MYLESIEFFANAYTNANTFHLKISNANTFKTYLNANIFAFDPMSC